MFDEKSRYAKVTPYLVKDRRGRMVQVVPAAPPLVQGVLGYHLRKQGQRLDHLAHRYLRDATQTYRILELMGVMHPDAAAEVDEIPIPRKDGA